MSKAFTREDDAAHEERVRPRPNPTLPPGATNWMTADGFKRFQDELQSLHEQRSAQKWSREMEQRLVDLEYLLSIVEVVSATNAASDEVRFGSTVTVRDEAGDEQKYRIVGLDETDMDRGWVSWISPIARALMGAKLGQHVKFRFPAGEKELLIVSIADVDLQALRALQEAGVGRDGKL
jgi:transcription elongation factor GreB